MDYRCKIVTQAVIRLAMQPRRQPPFAQPIAARVGQLSSHKWWSANNPLVRDSTLQQVLRQAGVKR